MPFVADAHPVTDYLPKLPPVLLDQCTMAADAYAAAARAGTNPANILVMASRALPPSDIRLITWAAHLGYREGLEVRS